MFDPALHDALCWTITRHGIRWRRSFKSEDAAWRALGRVNAMLPEAWREMRTKQGYAVVPAAWEHKPPSRKTGIHILWTKDAVR